MQSMIQDTLAKYFKEEEKDVAKIFDQLSFYIYSLKSPKSDLYMLAKILDEETLSKVIDYFGGDILKIPSKEDYQESLLISICFYLKEIKGWNWIEIKKFMDIPEKYKDKISMISVGGKINKVKRQLNRDLLRLTENIPLSDFHKYFLQSSLQGDSNIDESDLILCTEEDEENE